MDKSRSRDIRLMKQERKERMERGIIIEAKVPLVRRVVELSISLFFNLLIVFLVAVVVDDLYTMATGHHLWFSFIPKNISQVGRQASLVVLLLIPSFFILATVWRRYKKHLYDPAKHKPEEPVWVTAEELADYFQVPLEEIQRRQAADELVITENIDNERMDALRQKWKARTR